MENQLLLTGTLNKLLPAVSYATSPPRLKLTLPW